MPRTKRYEKINARILDEIENDVSRLESHIAQGEAWLVPFNAHYEALGELRVALKRAVNVLNDRSPDWERPRGQVLT